MMRHFLTLVFALVCQKCLGSVHADDHVEATKAAGKEHSGVYPAVSQGDKKFFGKDYAWDKRPAVDVLHFKHPYPAVQDSDDFDKDFVKDENNDDGSYAAQSEYDRLRHQLAMQKKAVEKALHHADRAENDMQDALKREAEARKKAEEQLKVRQEKAAAKAKAEAAAKAKAGAGGGSGKGEWIPDKIKDVWEKVPGSTASAGDVEVATSDTKKAMGHLEECKKELAAAREDLKKMMKELEEAKKEQTETEAALDVASSHNKELHAAEEAAHKAVKDQHQSYMDARTAYLKQQALVAKLEADIKVATTKVKAFRDGEDKNGGVYNSNAEVDKHGFPIPKLRSVARSSVAPLSVFALAVMLAFFAH
jgi:peptidoglycan hydrolase CwlO-like protein